jgi:phosphoglucomutase
MDAMQAYQKWLNYKDLPYKLHQDLISIQGNTEEIEDRFGHRLHFGTAGLRGIMGAGLNRLNIYTIRKTSWAFGQYLLKHENDAAERGVAIGYDCRHNSSEFAKETGLVLAALGIRAYVSPYLCPTPEVSFSVRHFGAAAGVMITASHNPPEYNGYKVYGPDGCQLFPDATTKIRDMMTQNDEIFDIPILPLADAESRGLFEWISKDVRTSYIETVVREVQSPSVSNQQRKTLSVVYTPLHGAGNVPVREALHASGYEQIHIVKEQEEPNGDFPTVKSPNPEEPQALDLAIQTARNFKADIVMGTDPDSDRVGIAIRDKSGSYQLLTGNQVGALLMNFILSTRKAEGRLPNNEIVFKTIVTSELGKAVADSHKIPLENTLTGFKYIGERITHYEQTGEHKFLFGYEESYGYLISHMVRDKDAVQTCLAISEMATFYKNKNQTLLDALEELFVQFGYFKEELISKHIQGADASKKLQAIMDGLRKDTPDIQGLKLTAIEDYETSKHIHVDENGKPTSASTPLTLPKSDVLKYLYEDGSWLAFRPSGTEPKLKAYLAARGKSISDCEEKIKQMRSVIEQRVE